MRLHLLVVLVAACSPALPEGSGTLTTPFGTLWYNVVGTGRGTPAILLHGGPGVSSYYLNPMAPLGSDRPIVFYDQIGSGRSHSTVDSTHWTIAGFVAELDTLRRALGLERVHLIGHSWGTILAAEYWRAHPDHVASIVFMSPSLSIPAWLADADTLLMTMPDSIQWAVAEHESMGTYAEPAYQNAVTAYYQRYVARRLPWSADVDSAFATANMGIYLYMWGPSEFTATGTLKTYDASGWLHEINVPVLFTTGEFDEARPPTVRWQASLIPGAEVAIIPGAGHLTMQDNAAENNRIVRDFLTRKDR